MEARGYNVFIHPQTYDRNHQSAGTPEQKLKAFYDLWENPDIHVIWAAGGGNRCLHWIDQIDYSRLKTPKPVIGFSDVTALLNALYKNLNTISFHGSTFGRLKNYQQLDHLLALLGGQNPPYPMDTAKIIIPGSATGYLMGGNLSIVQYLPAILAADVFKGAILFLEDCQEELSRIDRMLRVMRQTKIFEHCKGLIFGSFDPIPETGKPFGFTLEDIIREHTNNLNIPVVMQGSFGHTGAFYSFPVGGFATLDTSQHYTKLTLQ